MSKSLLGHLPRSSISESLSKHICGFQENAKLFFKIVVVIFISVNSV